MKPSDIAHLVTLGSPTLSPDGRSAVVAATRPDLEADDYRSALWLVATDGSVPPRPFTHGQHDSNPAISPDGRWLAFLRRSEPAPAPKGGADDAPTHRDKPQVHLMPLDGGDARAVTALPLGAGAPRWAPDGSALAFVARIPDAGRYGLDPSVPPEKEPPRRITELTFRRDNLGFLTDRRSHVFIVDVAADGTSATPAQVSDGDWDDVEPAWSPDSTRIAFLSARHAGREHDRRTDAFVIARDGSGLVQVTDTSLWASGLAWTSDGRELVVAASAGDADGHGWLARNAGLWLVPVGTAPAAATRLTDAEPVNVGAEWIDVDGASVLVAVENRGALDLTEVALDGSGTRTVCAGPRQITAIARRGAVTVATISDATTCGELARLDGDAVTVLTEFGRDAAAVSEPAVELTARAPDGYPVHGWLALPAGDGPHPVLLMIHGGPFAQYGWTNFDEAQVYAGAGFAVVYGNPRGSSGYGEAHGRYIVGDVGERQTPDLLALLDHALTRDDLDADRVGVLGGSHGGYMTSWLVGHSDRFRAAVSERSVNAIDSFEGSSDIGWDFADELYGTDVADRRRQSPLTYADAITTPLLIVHSEHDWRCPLEQAQRLYVALRKRDAVVELLLFPGEGHEMSRSGTPRHRVARFEAIVEWFGRHLS